MQAEGNKEFSAGNFKQAIEHFSAAINLDPSNHVLYSNRSACHVSLLNALLKVAIIIRMTMLSLSVTDCFATASDCCVHTQASLNQYDTALEDAQKVSP